MRRLLVLVAAATLLGAIPAAAAPPETVTIVEKNVTDTFVDTFRCEFAEEFEITVTFNHIEHVTAFPDGRVHFTFTDTGTFEAEALDPTQPDASGRFTIWGGFNDNGKTVNGTFTLSITGRFEDGTRINTQAVDHFNVRPDGMEFFFGRCRD
jgi:hypothetical protein